MVNNPNIRFAGFADDWVQRKFGDVVEKQIKGKAQFEKLAPGDVEYLDTSRLNGGQAILTDGLKDVTLDDILILWDGSKAGTVYHEFEGALGSTLKAYRTSANSKFVYQYLKRHQDNIYNHYRTPNIPHVQKDFLNVFMINVPNTDEQDKIGSIFSTLDHKIGLEERQIALLKDLKKGYLQKMFPKNGATVPELRFAGFADDWEERKLGDITTSFSGGTPSAGNPGYYKGDIPFIRSGEINSDKTELFLTADGLKNSSAKMVSVGDILYALYGATSGEVGLSQINGAINQAILAIRPIGGYSSHFIMQWLRLQKQKIIDKYLQGGQGNLSGSIVKNLILNVPNFEEQQQIGNFFKQLDNTIAANQRKLDLLKDLKKGLLQQMFL